MKSDPLAKSMKRLERVKRSGSEFRSELSNVFQLLRALADFCVGRFVGRFIGHSSTSQLGSDWLLHVENYEVIFDGDSYGGHCASRFAPGAFAGDGFT